MPGLSKEITTEIRNRYFTEIHNRYFKDLNYYGSDKQSVAERTLLKPYAFREKEIGKQEDDMLILYYQLKKNSPESPLISKFEEISEKAGSSIKAEEAPKLDFTITYKPIIESNSWPQL
ncbi:hypothetical protein L3V79_08880 [Thiotrichales bacterium 19S9-12]|nr:hypothetical protein [Thiotrichales bacterium 19S9-11]MCF6812470.1 hypothetical protein [Thiotrichales bacterium 19S9-12]